MFILQVFLFLLTLACAAVNVPLALDGHAVNQVALALIIGMAAVQGLWLVLSR